MIKQAQQGKAMMKRRDFLKVLGAGVFLRWDWLYAADTAAKRPNIIYIYTDQQSASMMSCAGNRWLKTPAMDYIAENGIRFTRAYTSNPVCSPARVSLITGRFAGYFNDNNGRQVRENSGSIKITEISQQVKDTTIAAFLKKAGYDLIYGGKEHLPEPLRPETLGFRYICQDERDELAKKAADFIKSPHKQPYFLVVSLINPHDICYMAIQNVTFENAAQKKQNYRGSNRAELEMLKAVQIPEGVTKEEFLENYCPPLPENYEPQKDEPKAVKSLLERRKFRIDARNNYTDNDWRLHRWAYCRLTELVDKEVQVILDAVKETGQEKDTLIIFSSDHGDMDSSHRIEHKTCLYEEAANIPFMAMWKGHIPAGRVDGSHLISNGLDLLPTVCDYAGVKGSSDPRGMSLRGLFEGSKTQWRETLGVESEIGRMVVHKGRYKYIRYDAEGKEEHLLDLNRDPHETTHFTDDRAYASKLDELRKSFEKEWFTGY